MTENIKLTIELDSNLKRNLESVCEEHGLSLNKLFSIFAEKIGSEKNIPQNVLTDPFYDKDHIARLKERIANAKMGVNMHEHELIGVDDDSYYLG